MQSRQTKSMLRAAQSKRQANQHHPRRAMCLERLEGRNLMAGDMVIEWNNRLIETIRNDTTLKGPTWASRNGAIMHLAIYDAVNAITQTHSSYVTKATAPATASKEAAVATAAHDTLVALYPGQKARIDAWLTQSLATIRDGASENAGIAIGRQVANEILALRQDDGSYNNGTYVVNPAPGHWSPDPLNPGQTALGPNWGSVKPFAIDDPKDFLAPPPPALTSTEYAAAFNEVKSLGAKNSTTRTADQTQIGIFWGYDRGGLGPPMHIYNQATQTIAIQKKNSLVDNARLFALVNLAMADAGITSWDTKYVYDFWRPVTAIRRGAEDGNAATVGDPNWEPLGAPGGGQVPNFTPPFPAYTSGHATFGAATFRTLANFYGTDNISFTLRSDELPGVTRSYTSLSQASMENGISRIYLGIHWRFDNTMGQTQGNQISDYVFQNYLQPLTAGRASIGVQSDGGGFQTRVLPAGEANITLRRSQSGNELEVVNNRTGAVLFRRDLNDLNSIRFQAATNRISDILTVDQAYGGRFKVKNGIQYNGNAQDGDRFWFAGSETENDNVTLDCHQLSLPGIEVCLNGVTYVGLAGHGGNDVITVKGNQSGRRIDVRGFAGDDRYVIAASNATISLEQNQGTDTVDFSGMATGVNVDLALNAAQRQAIGNAITLLVNGDIENMVGSNFADRLRGNGCNNLIQGRGGNDLIFGRAGNDQLYGDDGNDVLVGDAGNDELCGGAGNDILIGGVGQDSLCGDAGENILIGGSTAFDGNDAALLSLMAEWTAPRSRAVRVANLTNGSGSRTRANGNNFLTTSGRTPTVRNDGVYDSITSINSADWQISS